MKTSGKILMTMTNWNECDDKPINPVATETLLNDEIRGSE